ncbi:unnamed protein product, partial [Penicillium nalgiovense]
QDELVCFLLFLLPLLGPAICGNSPMAHAERSGLGTRIPTQTRLLGHRLSPPMVWSMMLFPFPSYPP